MSSCFTLDRANRAALWSLGHPATLAAVALLLLNGHLLRRAWPSWLTGKLGDFAWLFFAPLALVAVLTLVLPRRLAGRERLAGLLAFPLGGGRLRAGQGVASVPRAGSRRRGSGFKFSRRLAPRPH